ncbi:PREDICTED: protein YLS9-like [Tarenaya hassleriana]|uniref:protein YLS9-like n=1 Tax=Tarenaya hassleriana TaxID=28532 RepID=UPI00053C79EA|nr:PREDICTED: protein YLS9-like [Tarenaya hassleriana]
MPSPRGEETQPKRETTGQASSGHGTHRPLAPPHPQPPENLPPPYPPVMGYPGNPNYPNGPYNSHYVSYAQAPPASYYPTQQQFPGHRSPDSVSAGFFRGIITGLIILVIILCLSTVATWLILRPQIPIFAVTHFSVSGFNGTRPDFFTAQWTANLTVENPNAKLKAYFNRIQGFIYHQNSIGEDELLTTGFFTPVYVETKKTAAIGERFSAEKAAEKGEQPAVPGWVAEEMRKEKESNGTVSFSLRMFVLVTFKAEGWSARERGLKVLCEKLKVGFEGGGFGNGAVLLPKPSPCLVYI